MPDPSPFPHFLIKEIFEQPRAVGDTVRERISPATGTVVLPGISIAWEELRALHRISIAASGTSRHAGLAGAVMIQELAGVPVEVDYASEFQYRTTGVGELTLLISQSGETADTASAQRHARMLGSRTLAITNVADSTIARQADGVVYTHAGPEFSIASTKSFTAQLAALFLFAVYLGEIRSVLTAEQARRHVQELLRLPGKLQTVLQHDPLCAELASQYGRHDDFLFIGRGIHYPIAMDGALKLKEISYIHAEGYPAGEIKHGPYALIGESLPVVALAARDRTNSTALYDRAVADLAELKQRGGRIIAVAAEGDEAQLSAAAEHVISIPSTPELLLPILEIVPLQLLAYHVAVQRGCDVDRPRNLVKSVTQE